MLQATADSLTVDTRSYAMRTLVKFLIAASTLAMLSHVHAQSVQRMVLCSSQPFLPVRMGAQFRPCP
jgi:hypothetical protein